MTRWTTQNRANFLAVFTPVLCNSRWEATMDIPSKNEITQWVADCKGAKGEALEQLLPLVYDELHRRAVQLFSQESAGHTLQPTALVNEVYLRLLDQRKMDWQNRAQFFALAARIMRRILVSHA